MLHRARDLLMRQRAQLINVLRALLAEFGITAAQGRDGIKELLAYNLTRIVNIVGTKPLMAAIVA
jgi:transposase